MRLKIHNIGPVNDIDILLNRVNVFIGPQSIGKSTIAKIITYCMWVEKDAIRNQSVEQVDNSYIQDHLFEYHKLESYLSEDSSFMFEGDFLKLSYNFKEGITVEKKKDFSNMEIGKVAYVPAERNVINLPNIETLKLPSNYIREYIFDWLNIHKKYSRQSPVLLPKLNIKYYFDDNKGDTLLLPNNKEITLDVASSGLQSVVPLYVYVKYITEWIYKHQEDISYEANQRALNAIIDSILPKNISIKADDSIRSGYYELVRNTLAHSNNKNLRSSLGKVVDNITKPHYTSLVIEEPELNLFPNTQVDILYDIFNMINVDRDRIFLTTHSPYILYALNNVILANRVKDNISEDDYNELSCKNINIDPKLISVWSVDNGKIIGRDGVGNTTIQDENGMIRKNFFDDSMRHIMNDFNEMAMYLEE